MKYLSLLSIALLVLSACEPNYPTHPNIILIMTDDQGYGDLGHHGNDSIDTPVLDELAGESTTFDRFFVSPVCAPTRASLLTGRYHPRTGTTWVTHRRETMQAEEKTLAEYLKEAGYATGIFGKWHNGEQYPNDPNGQGFDEFLGFCAGHWNNYFDTRLQHNQEMVRTEGYITDVLTDAALAFIRGKKEQPFFCYLPYNTPHSPMQVPDRYFDKYKKRGLTDFNAAAYGMVENVDDNIGRVLALLDSLGLADNTLVIFTTDNGPNGNRYNAGMRGWKGSMHEGGSRVPLMMRWPAGGLKAGRVIDPVCMHIDLLPTILNLGGIAWTPTDSIDGKDQSWLLRNESTSIADRMLFTFPTLQHYGPFPAAVRTQQYRLVMDREGVPQLFDMVADPGQRKNIADQQPQLTDSLMQAYRQKFETVSSPGMSALPIPVGYAEAPRVVMPAPGAILRGNLQFKGDMGWANDWITNWKLSTDLAIWPLDIQEAGTYEVGVQYAVPDKRTGARMAISIDDQRTEAYIREAHDPDYLPSPDRVKRKEVYEKEWAEQSLGTLNLEAGTTQLILRAEIIRKGFAPEIKAVWMQRLAVQ